MAGHVAFRPLAWNVLERFLSEQQYLAYQDLDHSARYITPHLYATTAVEGLYLNGELVGFARWDRSNGHLCSIYVSPLRAVTEWQRSSFSRDLCGLCVSCPRTRQPKPCTQDLVFA